MACAPVSTTEVLPCFTSKRSPFGITGVIARPVPSDRLPPGLTTTRLGPVAFELSSLCGGGVLKMLETLALVAFVPFVFVPLI